MIFFRSKHAPSVGRWLHAAEGLGITLVAGALGALRVPVFETWYQGVMWGAGAVVILGFVWEFLTPILARLPFPPFNRWGHAKGDILDWLAFVLGAVLVALPTGLWG